MPDNEPLPDCYDDCNCCRDCRECEWGDPLALPLVHPDDDNDSEPNSIQTLQFTKPGEADDCD